MFWHCKIALLSHSLLPLRLLGGEGKGPLSGQVGTLPGLPCRPSGGSLESVRFLFSSCPVDGSRDVAGKAFRVVRWGGAKARQTPVFTAVWCDRSWDLHAACQLPGEAVARGGVSELAPPASGSSYRATSPCPVPGICGGRWGQFLGRHSPQLGHAMALVSGFVLLCSLVSFSHHLPAGLAQPPQKEVLHNRQAPPLKPFLEAFYKLISFDCCFTSFSN